MTLRWFIENLAGVAGKANVGQPVRGVLRHAAVPTNVIRNGVRHVRPDTTPLLVQRGWTQSGNVWRGSYVTRRGGTFDGKIERRGDVFDVLIRRPPEATRKSPKFACFAKRGDGWWAVHLHDNPCDGDPSAIVAYMERLLNDALQRAD